MADDPTIPPMTSLASPLTSTTASTATAAQQSPPQPPQPPHPLTLASPLINPTYPDPIPGIFPFGTICTFSGLSGVGKTAMIASWLDRWTSNRTICHHPTTRPTAIGIIAMDRRWQSHRRWFELAGVADKIVHYSARDDPRFQWGALRQWQKIPLIFGQLLDRLELPPGALVICDPLALFIPGDTNKYKDVAIGIGELDQVVLPRKISVLGVFHQSKPSADPSQRQLRPQDRIMGSGGQLGFSDTAMYMMSPEEAQAPFTVFGWVPHNAPAESFQFTRDPNGLFIPYDEYDDIQLGEKVLACLLPDRNVSARVLMDGVMKSCNVSAATAKRYIGRLIQDGRIMQPARGRYRRTDPS